MQPAPGIRIGPYEIVSLLGAGGMGEVWKARDTRLNRFVAIKFAAANFSERFEREARAVAALNHPHICTLYDVGPDHLVMELVDGQPLTGPLPLDRALTLASQILSALDAAHRKGIIHRDLKPANILVTKQGVKLLDFGLAKMQPDIDSEGLAEARTEATTGTHILGTVGYMSPEQVQGRSADARSDIFSFGLVLYEMLTGRRAFEGTNPASVIAELLHGEPPPLPSPAPPALQQVLKRCLAKDPDERWQSVRDLRSALEWTVNIGPTTVPAPTPPRRRTLLPTVAGIVLLAAAAIAGWWQVARISSNDAPPVQLDLYLGTTPAADSVGAGVVLSPDSTRLVFVSQGPDGSSQLSTRRLDQSEVLHLPHTEGAQSPFFSPDGLWVGFFAGGKLKKTRLDGGDPIILCDAPAGRGASWSEAGYIVATLDVRTGLSRVPAEGGQPVPLTTLGAGHSSHRWPWVLPGGTHALFAIGHGFANYEESDIAVLAVADGQPRVILPRTGMYPQYVASAGMLTYVTKGRLFAVPFDLDRLETLGPATLVLEEVSNDTNYGFAQVDVSRDGRLLYRSGRTERFRTVAWLQADGSTSPVIEEPAAYLSPRVSPDGSRMLWSVNEGSVADIWSYDFGRGSRARLTNGEAINTHPVWSPDGRFVFFSSTTGIRWARADGAGKPQALTESSSLQLPSSFSPDGTRLVVSDVQPQGARILTLPIEYGADGPRAGRPELFLESSSGLPYPALSSNGKWLAYADGESGRYEVYVRAFPDRGTKWQISNTGGTMPFWSRNGRELFYRTEDSRIMMVDYSVQADRFIPSKPRLWTTRPLANTGMSLNLDLAPSGDRFMALMPAGPADAGSPVGHVTLILNAFGQRVRATGPALQN